MNSHQIDTGAGQGPWVLKTNDAEAAMAVVWTLNRSLRTNGLWPLVLLVVIAGGHFNRAMAQETLGRRRPDTRIRTFQENSLPGAVSPSAPRTNASVKLPPLPEGVLELKFEDFFKLPVGAFGLEMTDKLKSLDGRRVRILGYMVREESEKQGGSLPEDGIVTDRIMLTPSPVSVSFAHYGMCDDLPPQTLYVTLPDHRQEPMPHQRGPLLVTGTLSLGNHTEADGRISAVRLKLDPQPATASAAPAPASAQTAKTPSPSSESSGQNNLRAN